MNPPDPAQAVPRGFPILCHPLTEPRELIQPFTIPWAMIAPHEEQTLRNHCNQTLERLAQRGGLGYCEAVAVLEDRKWTRMDQREALRQLREKVAEFEARPIHPAPEPPAMPEADELLLVVEQLLQAQADCEDMQDFVNRVDKILPAARAAVAKAKGQTV